MKTFYVTFSALAGFVALLAGGCAASLYFQHPALSWIPVILFIVIAIGFILLS